MDIVDGEIIRWETRSKVTERDVKSDGRVERECTWSLGPVGVENDPSYG
jgi:hypothetical protein